uniref:Serine/threonine-protein kinase TOR n=1 Tax=Ditylenchus dipsaci TaxID=166011 RepID=A0A915E5G1_9BILA
MKKLETNRSPDIEHMERVHKNLLILRSSPDIYNRCLNMLNNGPLSAIFEAINHPEVNEKKAGIFLIVCFVELNNAEETTQVTKFTRNLLKILTCGDESVMKLASRAIAYLIQTSKTFAVEQMENSLNQCSEWLEETQRNEERLLAAVILAKDLALFTSSHFFQRATHFFNNIFKVIRDPKLALRTAAIQALQAALAVTSQREAKHKNEWYKRCFEEASIKSHKEDALHASLLIFNELLRIANVDAEKIRLKTLDITASQRARTVIGLNPVEWLIAPAYPVAVESRTARALVTEHYFTEIVTRCMELRSSKSTQCQLVLLEIFPRLTSFSDLHDMVPFKEMLNHALQLTHRYPQALLTLGLLAVDRPTEIKHKAQSILKILVDILQQVKKKPIDPMVFKCMTLLVRSQKSGLCEPMRTTLPLLFSTGLSKGLTEVLKEVVESIPQLKTDVLDGLMEQLYQILMNRSRPSKLAAPTPPPVPTGPIQPTNIELTKLALKTLGEFEFQRHALQMFVRYIAQGYLVCDSTEIRLTAVYCCAGVVKPFIKVHELVENDQKTEVYSLIKNVLECLLRTAVVDSEVEVRLSVLQCFSAMERDFLFHLAQKEMLEILFMTLHDENYQMQEESVSLLGQLSELNPAMIFPKLRRVVLESISQLVNSRAAKIEEHSAKIIAILAAKCSKFMSPYMNSLLMALIPHLHLDRRNVDVTVHVLNALSELSLIGGVEIARSVKELFPSLIAYLQDSTSLARREAALRVMGSICLASAYVVDPYKDYPELLDILLKLLKTELSVSMRRQTMKVLGIIGALDPYTHKVYLGTVYSHKSKSLALTLPNTKEIDDPKSDVSDIIQWFNYERCTLLEYYPALAIANLVEMLQDEALVTYHKDIVYALLQIFSSLGVERSSKYVNQVVPRLVSITENCKPEFREFFLAIHAANSCLTGKAWNWGEGGDYRSLVIGILEEIGKAFGSEFSPYVTDLQKTHKSGTFMCSLNYCLCGSSHPFDLDPILSVLNKAPHDHVRQSALDTVIALATHHSISENAPEIMQTWLRVICEKKMQDKLMQLLNILVLQMWDKFLVYKDRVSSALSSWKVDASLRQEYFEQLTLIHNSITMISSSSSSAGGFGQQRPDEQMLASIYAKRIPLFGSAASDGQQQLQAKSPLSKASKPLIITSVGRENRHLINIDQLRSHFENSIYSTEPSASIRACAALAEVNEQLAKELFNAAFMSVWTDIRESEQDELTNQLVDVLTLCPHAEPIQAILNLAEFMDHSEKGPLPVNYKMLSKCAEQTRAYAKALRYKELEIISSRNGEPTPEDCQALITYANKLNLEEGAAGVVQYAEKKGMEISGRWYEKLGEWEKALEMYSAESAEKAETSALQPGVRHNSGGDDTTRKAKDELLLHQMRCLEALGRWSELECIGEKVLSSNDLGTVHVHHHSGAGSLPGQLNLTLNEADKRQKIAQMTARSCWAMGNFEKMRNYVQQVNQNTQEGSFLRAVAAIHNNDFKEASGYANKVRDMFDAELTAVAAESYERAYGAMILVQQLAELEEAVEYKMIPEREARIAVLWSRRLQGCRRNIVYWQRILQVRSVVLSQNELRPLWIKFSSLCRRQNKLSMSRNVLQSLLNISPETPLEAIQMPLDKPQLSLAVCKQLWTEGHRRSAFGHLENLTGTLHRLFSQQAVPFEPTARITAKCYLKLGEWHSLLQPLAMNLPSANATLGGRRGSISVPVNQHPNLPLVMGSSAGPMGGPQQYFRQLSLQKSPHFTPSNFSSMEQSTQIVLNYYKHATTFDPHWYKAWHRLATTYYNLVMADRQSQPDPPTRPPSAVQPGVVGVEAVEVAGAFPPLGLPPHIPLPPVEVNEYGVPAAIYLQQQHLLEQQRLEIDEAMRHGMAMQTNTTRSSASNSPQSPMRSQQQQLLTLYAVNAVRCFFKAIQLAEGSRLDDTLRLLMLWFDYGERPEVFEQLRDSVKLVPVESWLEVMPQLIARLDSQRNSGMLIKQLVIDISKVHPQALIYALTAAVKARNAQRSKIAKEILEIVAESRPTFVEQAQLVNEELIRCAILWHEQWHEALEDASKYYFQVSREEYRRMMNVLRPLHAKIEQGHTTLKEQSFNQTYYKELKDAYEHCEAYNRQEHQRDAGCLGPLLYLCAWHLRSSQSTDHYLLHSQSLQVIMTKQRPRKVHMRGSDGKEYAFLLKGHEDPRMDERVMQLFGLINSLILREADTCRRNLTIQRYSITTLSQSSGLIGWLPNCDTLHALIKDYREKKKIVLSEEHMNMQKLVVDIEKVTLMQKVEVFEETLRTTTGDDLRQALWMKSPNSEVWFDRRTNYTRSMACMSMVGYILGWEIDTPPTSCLTREKYPEKIPFRLTRMLIQAMEVTGIEGNYRLTCERVLRLLRNSNDSILAVLEAFIYDPVLDWKLPEGEGKRLTQDGGVVDRNDQPLPGVGAARRGGGDYEAINRVKAKLCGRDFNQFTEMSVPEQVSRLIEQATLNDNLCQCYIGWCPFW